MDGECLRCPAGKYNEVPGAGSKDFCKLCPAGKYSEGLGNVYSETAEDGTRVQALCARCPSGKFSREPGATSCTSLAEEPACPFPLLYFNPGDASSICIGCPAGYYGTCAANAKVASFTSDAPGTPWFIARGPNRFLFGNRFAADSGGNGVCNLAPGHNNCTRCPAGARCPGFSAAPLPELFPLPLPDLDDPATIANCSGAPTLPTPTPTPPPPPPELGALSLALGRDLPSSLAKDILAANFLGWLVSWLAIVPAMWYIAAWRLDLDKKLASAPCVRCVHRWYDRFFLRSDDNAFEASRGEWEKTGLCRRILTVFDADTSRAAHFTKSKHDRHHDHRRHHDGHRHHDDRHHGAAAGGAAASEDGDPPRYTPIEFKPQMYSGACSCTGLFFFLFLVSHYLLSRDLNNVQATSTLLLLDPNVVSMMSGRGGSENASWRGFGRGAELADEGPSLIVTILAAGEGARCGSSNGDFSLSPANALPWAHTSTACSEAGRFLHRFTCTACALTPTSALLVEANPSCQTLFLEAAAIDAQFNATKLRAATRVGSGTGLATSFNWTIGSVLSVVQDTRQPFESWLPGVAAPDPVTRMGYNLISYGTAHAYEPPGGPWSRSPSLNASDALFGSVIPGKSARLRIAVNFALESYYSRTTKQERATFLDKLNSVTAFWAVFGLFAGSGRCPGSFSSWWKKKRNEADKARKDARNRGLHRAPSAVAIAAGAGGAPAPPATPPPPTADAAGGAPAAAPLNGPWRRQTNPLLARVVWYPPPDAPAPGAFVEELPMGARTECGWGPASDPDDPEAQRWWHNEATNETSWYPPRAVTFWRPTLVDGSPAWKRLFEREGPEAARRAGLHEKVAADKLPAGAITTCGDDARCAGDLCRASCGWAWTCDGEGAPVWVKGGLASPEPPQPEPRAVRGDSGGGLLSSAEPPRRPHISSLVDKILAVRERSAVAPLPSMVDNPMYRASQEEGQGAAEAHESRRRRRHRSSSRHSASRDAAGGADGDGHS